MIVLGDNIIVDIDDGDKVLKVQVGAITNTGIVVAFGNGSWMGYIEEQVGRPFKNGSRILFSEYSTYEVDGKNVYVVKAENVVAVL